MLSDKEISRYSRHLLLSEIGMEGQEKLADARVLVIGAGGLGSPVLLYLSAAGVGTIGVVDFDRVDESNLQRQILFDSADVGKPKAVTAKMKLESKNPFVKIEAFQEQLTVKNALDLFSKYDIIVDGTDNFVTRYMVNDACFLLNKILVSGSIFKFEGQVAVFDFTRNDGPTYRCLFPFPPPPELALSCSEIGVIGVLPGIIGTLLANETLKLILGIGEVLSGKLLIMNTLSMHIQTLEFERNAEAIKAIPKTASEFEAMDYEYFCGKKSPESIIQEVSVKELLDLIASQESIQIIDVRELDEGPEIARLKDLKIPLGEIVERADEIARDKKVIFICKSGIRSAKAIEILESKFTFKNLYNLHGGVIEWIMKSKEIQKV